MPVNLASRRDLDEEPKLSSDEDEENAIAEERQASNKALYGCKFVIGRDHIVSATEKLPTIRPRFGMSDKTAVRAVS